MTPVSVTQGSGPIVLGIPHAGTYVPPHVAGHLNATGLRLADTDWHVDRLYADLIPHVTTVTAQFHRYVIDANRDPAGGSLYPGQNTTDLVPLTDFDGAGIWKDEPHAEEIERRRIMFHEPYHAALQGELDRVHALHGVAILYDCHSIRSHIPYLFDGTLPDFNIGTNGTTTCAPEVETATMRLCKPASSYSTTLNGRFKGGWATRHYGNPTRGIHAIQMELAQSTYLSSEGPPWAYDPAKAALLRPHLKTLLTTLAELAPTLKGAQ